MCSDAKSKPFVLLIDTWLISLCAICSDAKSKPFGSFSLLSMVTAGRINPAKSVRKK